MGTARQISAPRRRIALHLSRLLVLASTASVVVLTQAGSAGAVVSSFQSPYDRPTGNSPNSVAVADFDGDGHLDNVSAGNHISVVFGSADGDPDGEDRYHLDPHMESVAVGDFDADGHPDVVVSHPYESTVSVLLGNPEGWLGDPASFQAGVDPTSVIVGDVNGDGDPDLVATNGDYDGDGGGGTVSILLGGPGGTFGAPTAFPAGVYPTSVAMGDFDGDSLPDLVVGTGGAHGDGLVWILLGNGDGTFEQGGSQALLNDEEYAGSIAVGDFNGDADPDLAVVVQSVGVRVLLGAPGGTFALADAYDVGEPYDVAVGDFNSDSHADLVLAGAAVLHGEGDGTFGDVTNFRSRGVPVSVAVGDVNSDSLPDLVVANAISVSNPDFGGVAVLVNNTDTTPPGTTITAGPIGLTNDENPTFAFTSSEIGSTFQCRVDDSDWSACTSPLTPEPLTDGTHTLEVRATDRAGNVDPTPATRTFTVDTVAPDTTITSGPNEVTQDNTPTFTFEASEPGTTFECSIAGSFHPCTSPYTSGDLGDGDFTFQVRAQDAAGNLDPTPASLSFTLDRNPPTTSISSGPSGATGDSTPTFEFTSPEPRATFECRVDAAAFEACTSPHTTAALDDGDHVFYVRAVDRTGNVDPIPAAGAFTVDTIAPDTTIAGGPTGLTNDRTPTFSWSHQDGALTHECRVDDAPFTACTSPHTVDPLSGGPHTFEVRGIDGGGNVDPTPAQRAITVDTRASVTSITAGPTGLTDDATPAFAFANPELGSVFQCRIAPGGYTPCTSPYTVDALPDGEHTFEVRSIDLAGNTEDPAVTRTFTVDAAAPDTAITSGPTGTIHHGTPTFEFGSSEPGATLECRVDGAAFEPCTSPYTTTLLGDGSHTFEVRATDAVGNTDATPAGRTFTVSLDSTPPQTTITKAPPVLSLSSRATFVFTSSEGSSLFECRLDGGTWAACTSPRTYTGLRLGNHSFSVRAIDPAGNADPTPAKATWFTVGLLLF